jgi:hypothetical protein
MEHPQIPLILKAITIEEELAFESGRNNIEESHNYAANVRAVPPRDTAKAMLPPQNIYNSVDLSWHEHKANHNLSIGIEDERFPMSGQLYGLDETAAEYENGNYQQPPLHVRTGSYWCSKIEVSAGSTLFEIQQATSSFATSMNPMTPITRDINISYGGRVGRRRDLILPKAIAPPSNIGLVGIPAVYATKKGDDDWSFRGTSDTSTAGSGDKSMSSFKRKRNRENDKKTEVSDNIISVGKKRRGFWKKTKDFVAKL